MVRTVFLALVGIVALALVGGLLVPRLVDREGLRQELRRIAVRSLGQDVQVRGPIRIDLFPRPRLVASRLTSGPAGEGGGLAEIQIDRLRLELSPWALLVGRFSVQRIQLVRPSIRLDGPGLQRLGAALLAGTEQVASLAVVKGTVEPTGSTGPLPRIENLDLDLIRSAETGSLDLNAAATVHDQPVRIVAQSGPLQAIAAAQGRVTVGRGEAALTATFGGTVDTAGQTPTASGKLRVETSELGLAPDVLGAVLGNGDVLSLPALGHAWIESRMTLDRIGLSLDDLVAELPDASARASVVVGFAAQPSITADVTVDKARLQTGLERILGRAIRDDLLPALLVRTHGRLDLQATSLTVRDSRVGNSRLAVAWPGDGSAKVERAVAQLPGGTDVRFAGEASLQNGWRGPLEIAGDDLRTTLGWLGLSLEQMPPRGLRSAHGTLDLDVIDGRTIVEAEDFLLDTTKLVGRLAIVDGERPKLAVVGTADRVDLGTYLAADGERPDLAPAQELLHGVDLAVDASLGRVVWHRLQANGVQLRGGTDEGRFRLDELRIADLGSAAARIVGDGTIDGAELSLSFEASADRPSRPLRAVGLTPPLGLDRLGAARLKGEAHRTAQGSDVELTLTTPGLELDLSGDPRPEALRLTLGATAKDLAAAVEALGGRLGAPQPGPVPLHASGALRREGTATLLGAEILAGRTAVQVDLRHAEGPGPSLVSGAVGVEDLDPALLGMAGDLVAGAAALPAPTSWIGDWPTTPLPWPALDDVDLDLGLTASLAVEDETAEPPTLTARVQLSDSHLALHEVDMPLGGGRLQGVVTFDATPEGSGVLGAEIQLSGARAERLLPEAAATRGELDLDVSVASAGISAADIVGNLAGSGRIRLRHGGITDEAELTDLLLIEGPLRFDRGIATTSPRGLTLRFPGGEGSVALTADLLAWVGTLRAEAHGFDTPDKLTTIEAVGPLGRMRAVSRNFAASVP